MKDVLELKTYLTNKLTECKAVGISETIKDLENLILTRKAFDYNKFIDWLSKKNVFFMNSPTLFIRKCAYADINKGLFDKEPKRPILKPLFDDLKARHIYYQRVRDTSLLETYLTHILTEELLTPDQVKEWLHNAVDYIATLPKPNAKYFKDLFRKSQTMKALNLPYEWLDKKAEKEMNEWNKIVSQLDTN